jgi:hypothetical protein
MKILHMRASAPLALSPAVTAGESARRPSTTALTGRRNKADPGVTVLQVSSLTHTDAKEPVRVVNSCLEAA